jgi:hypothetical protein
MPVVSSGQVSLNDLHVEAGGTSGTECSFNDSDIRGLIGKGSAAQMTMSEWYGAANEVTLTSAGNVNGQAQRKQILASSFISAGGTLVIPSNIWVWSDSTGTAALTIDVANCTIKNSGKIIGRGSNGGGRGGNSSGNGGDAIKINSGITGVTIQNLSGGYIAGGGSGGARGSHAGSGGGAGGGLGGYGSNWQARGSGGALNANGGSGGSMTTHNNDAGTVTAYGGGGGGSGGGGAASMKNKSGDVTGGSGGGGGGRKLPGGSGSAGTGTHNNRTRTGYAGGSAGNAPSAQGWTVGQGGGGWGARGGDSTPYNRGVAGKAIDDSGVSYTLSNSGTIYGGT